MSKHRADIIIKRGNYKRSRDSEPERPRRFIRRVVIQDRHSSVNAERERDDGQRFHASNIDIEKCRKIAEQRGYDIAFTISFLNVSGSDMTRLDPVLELMGRPLDDPELVDALICADWTRFSRGGPEGLATVEQIRKLGADLICVDSLGLDIYDDASDPHIQVLNM